MQPIRTSGGFSLIEVMVSAAILLIVTVYIMQAFTVQLRNYLVVDQVMSAQQNLRVVADLVERDVRRAGFMVPPHAAVCGYDRTNGSDTLFVSNTDAIRSVFDLESAGEDMSGNYGAPVPGTTSAWNATGSSFSLTLGQLWADVAADGNDFVEGGGVIVVNRNNESGKIACGTITNITGNTLTVDFGNTSTGLVGSNANVVAVPAYVYTLAPGGGGPNQLRRSGTLLASHVDDFQVTYFFDLNNNRIIDPGESFGTNGGTDDPFGQAAATFPDATSLLEVQINVVVATPEDDPNPEFNQGAGQLTGNRATGLSGGDGKRRRVHSVRVGIRNSG